MLGLDLGWSPGEEFGLLVPGDCGWPGAFGSLDFGWFGMSLGFCGFDGSLGEDDGGSGVRGGTGVLRPFFGASFGGTTPPGPGDFAGININTGGTGALPCVCGRECS